MTPKDADRLLLDPRKIEFACSPHLNPAFAHADARTRDAHGLRLMDYIEAGGVKEAIPWLGQLVTGSIHDITRELEREPLKLSTVKKASGGSRLIAVPSYRRRCIGNLVGHVIEKTVSRDLPFCVRAYRRGDRDSVRETILDTAEAVANGKIRYWAKLDLKDFFWTVPHQVVLDGLRHYGFSERVTDIVAALLKTPGMKTSKGQRHRVDITKGIAAGLPEAPVLANLVPFAIDEKLGSNPKLFFVRWSDDFFVGGSIRDEVVGAVNAIRAWARTIGVSIKGVDPRMNSRKLVKDVKQERILFLGALIDHQGCVHMPAEKAREKLDKLRYMEEHPALDTVRGVSTYAGGNGIEVFDDEDRWNLIDGVERYWRPLDEPGTDRFLETARRTTMSPTDIPSGPGAVWVAELSLPHGQEGGGNPPSCPEPEHRDQPGADPEAEADSPDQNHRASGQVGLEGIVEDGTPIGIPSLWNREEPGGEDPGSQGARIRQEECIRDFYPYTEMIGGGDDEVYLSCDDYARSRSLTPSLYGFLEDDPLGSLLQEEVEGAWGGTREGEPPALLVTEEGIVVHLAYRRVEDGASVIGYQVGSSQPRVVRVNRSRPEVALVRAATRVLHSCADPIEIRMVDTWLAKGLLQPSRRFRSPYLLSAVVRLHRAAQGRRAVVVGGVADPGALWAALDKASTKEPVPDGAPAKRSHTGS